MEKNLINIRRKIDEIDEGILKLFIERLEQMEKVAEYKRANGLGVLDTDREEKKINSIREKCLDSGTADFAEILFRQIMAICREKQYNILQRKADRE